MELNSEFYFQLEASAGPFYQAMGKIAQSQAEQPPRHPLLQVQSGRAESPAWYLVQAAEFDPEPLSVKTLRVRDIYASPAIAQGILEMLAAERWLDRRGGAYHLTDLGRTVTTELLTRSQSLLAQVDVPAHIDLIRLESLLRSVIDASLGCKTPPGNWCLAHSRNRAPSDEEPVIVRLLHYFSDFNAFRDDAHMAAWQPKEVTGQQWETFAFIISGQANSAESLFEQLSYRGYSVEDYAAALSDLTERRWLLPKGDVYVATEVGVAIHTQVESLTDQYFYAPWLEALNERELAETIELLRVLREEWPS
ncbi:MAG: hypothetical protein AAF702_07620 [Chloroflexota bacterium]